MTLLSLSALACACVQAAEYEVSVPADLVHHLTDSEIYRDLPPGFPPFAMPEGLAVIGSQHRPPTQQVLLRSQPEGSAAQRAVVEALLTLGWINLSERRLELRDTGFIIPEGTGYDPATLCHDGYGTLEVRGESGVENRVYLRRIIRTAESGWEGCDPQPARDPVLGIRGVPPPNAPELGIRGIPPGAGIFQYLPSLEPPASPAPLYTPALIGVVDIMSSGSNDRYETEMTVPSGDLDPDGLNAHYAEQLREQGWRPDAQWSGELTAGGTWIRSPEDGPRLFLTLSLSLVEDGVYAMTLQMGEVE